MSVLGKEKSMYSNLRKWFKELKLSIAKCTEGISGGGRERVVQSNTAHLVSHHKELF